MRIERILLDVASTPWAMEPGKLRAMMSILRFAAQGGRHSDAEVQSRINAEKMHGNRDRAIASQPGGIALIGVRGVISNRARLVDDVSSGGGTSMEQFGTAFRQAIASDAIKAIILDVDSPGGSVYGTPEMADEIRAARSKKPVVAQVNALCASAAYWLASACEEVVCTPSGEVGSIGVYTVHEDISQMLEQEGVRETLISAGKYKTEGNPFEPLGEEARAAMQATVDDYYAMFIDSVARNRGTTTAAVRNGFGQGRTARAPAALGMKMIDRIGTLQDTLDRWGVRMSGKAKGANASSAFNASTPRLNLALRRQALIESE